MAYFKLKKRKQMKKFNNLKRDIFILAVYILAVVGVLGTFKLIIELNKTKTELKK